MAISTIVSTAMVDALARDFNIELRRTLTGFKYIGDQITLLQEAGEESRFILGFEESYGYLSGAHVRDKDAVNASLLICQMAAWHKARGCNLYEAMQNLYQRYGFYRNGLVNVEFPGAAGAARMKDLVDGLRQNPPCSIAGRSVCGFIDYAVGAPMPGINLTGEAQMLPSANVLQFDLEGDAKVIVRPSGTEPKVKAYLFACEKSETAAVATIKCLEEELRAILQ